MSDKKLITLECVMVDMNAYLEENVNRPTCLVPITEDKLKMWLADLAKVEAKVERLTNALEPFVSQGQDVGKREPDEVRLSIVVTRGDLRYARAALKEE